MEASEPNFRAAAEKRQRYDQLARLVTQRDMASGLRLCAEHFASAGWMNTPKDLHCAYGLTLSYARCALLESVSTEEISDELVQKVWNETTHLRPYMPRTG